VRKVEAEIKIEMGGLPVGLNAKIEERFLVEIQGEQIVLRQPKDNRIFVFAIQKNLLTEKPEPKVTRISGTIRIDFYIAREITNVKERGIPEYDLKIQNGALSFKLQQECPVLNRLCQQLGYPGVTLDPRIFRSHLTLKRKVGGRVVLDAEIPSTSITTEFESMRIDLRPQLPELSTTYTLDVVNTYIRSAPNSYAAFSILNS
jgi:hypothetical protein